MFKPASSRPKSALAVRLDYWRRLCLARVTIFWLRLWRRLFDRPNPFSYSLHSASLPWPARRLAIVMATVLGLTAVTGLAVQGIRNPAEAPDPLVMGQPSEVPLEPSLGIATIDIGLPEQDLMFQIQTQAASDDSSVQAAELDKVQPAAPEPPDQVEVTLRQTIGRLHGELGELEDETLDLEQQMLGLEVENARLEQVLEGDRAEPRPVYNITNVPLGGHVSNGTVMEPDSGALAVDSYQPPEWEQTPWQDPAFEEPAYEEPPYEDAYREGAQQGQPQWQEPYPEELYYDDPQYLDAGQEEPEWEEPSWTGESGAPPALETDALPVEFEAPEPDQYDQRIEIYDDSLGSSPATDLIGPQTVEGNVYHEH